MKYIGFALLLLLFSLSAFAKADIVQSTDILIEPYPKSTILVAGTDKFLFTVQSRIPTVCRYSLNENLPYEEMHSFDSISPTLIHTVEIKNLNTNTLSVNYLYVRCVNKPSDFLKLAYTCLPKEDISASRVAFLDVDSLINFPQDKISNVGLWSTDKLNRDEITQIRNANHNALVLFKVSVTTAPLGLAENYYLKNTAGEKIEASPGRYRLNLLEYQVGEYVYTQAYNKLLDSGLMYDGYFVTDLLGDYKEIARDYHGRVHDIDTNNDKTADNIDAFEHSWRDGILYTLRCWKWLIPYAPIVAYTSFSADSIDMFKLLNGKGIVYDISDIKADNDFVANILSDYENWMNRILSRKVVIIESVIDSDLSADAQLRIDGNPCILSSLKNNHSIFRYGYILTLMYDGYFSQKICKTVDNALYWRDEFNFDLGKAVSKVKYYLPGSDDNSFFVKNAVVDDYKKISGRIFRRDFEKGIAILNASKKTVKIVLEKPYRKLLGNEAPLYNKIYDNLDTKDVTYTKSPKNAFEMDFSSADKSLARFVYGENCFVFSHDSTVTFDIDINGDDKYSFGIWCPNAKNISGLGETVFYDLYVNDEIVNSKKIDKSSFSNTKVDLFRDVELKKGDIVSLAVSGDGDFLIDVLFVDSNIRYNDGSVVTEVDLAENDGIILENIN